MKISAAERTANYVILIAFAICLFPLVTVVVAAFGVERDAPGGLANLGVAWEMGHFGTYLRNSSPCRRSSSRKCLQTYQIN